MSVDSINLDPSIRHGFAQVGEVRLHYAECGSGGRLVVLLHGFPECWYSWRHQLKALGEHYQVIAPDMRGYNLSAKPGRVGDYRLEKLVGDVMGLIRHFGTTEAAIVGHDWGAAVAWSLAAKHPECVWKLAALQVPPLPVWLSNMTAQQLGKSWYMLFFQLPLVPEALIRANDFASLERMFTRTARRGTFSDTDLAIYKTALRQRQPADETDALTAAINYYRANALALFLEKRRDSPTKPERVRVPTLFIYGERDFAVAPPSVRGVGAYVDAPYREVRLPDSNHWVQQEAPAEVNAALLEFLKT